MPTIQEMITVMQAFADGKEIQAYNKIVEEPWIDVAFPIWDWNTCDYRVKPREPREFWLWNTWVYYTKAEAEKDRDTADGHEHFSDIIHVREVIETED